jgi:hypothetical protein
MMKSLQCVILVGATLLAVPLHAQTPAPADAVVYIITPRDGQKVRSPFTVRFGLRNMGVTRAGDTTANMGHHHLLVDVTEPVEENQPLPTDRKYLHFGSGQTETQLDLPPGTHTLQLVLGDAEHKPFQPVVASKKVTITVVKPRPPRTSSR